MAFEDYSLPSMDYIGATPDFSQTATPSFMDMAYTPLPYDFSSYAPQPSFMDMASTPQYDFGSYQPSTYDFGGYSDTTNYLPSMDYTGYTTGAEKPWYEKIGDWAIEHPDRAVGAGLGVLNGIGGMMAARQSNKFAKQAAKRNKQLTAFEAQQMARMQKNQAVNDSYNYSIDKTTPNQVAYTPLTAEQAMHYGETGAPFQQVVTTPGETTRTRLACGGLAGLEQQAQHLAMGGQADTVPAMLSGGEYVMDADVVAALGDGNTEAGASALDALRENIRKHKRSAPAHKIPPKAKSALHYLSKGKK